MQQGAKQRRPSGRRSQKTSYAEGRVFPNTFAGQRLGLHAPQGMLHRPLKAKKWKSLATALKKVGLALYSAGSCLPRTSGASGNRLSILFIKSKPPCTSPNCSLTSAERSQKGFTSFAVIEIARV